MRVSSLPSVKLAPLAYTRKPMGLLGALRLGVGSAISRVLAWLFAKDWPRKLLAHGLAPETKRRLAHEIAPEAVPDQDVAHAWLVKLGAAGARDVVLRAIRHDFPESRPRLAIELALQARHLAPELLEIDAAVQDLVLNQERTLPYAYRQLERLIEALERHAQGFARKRALELGPGHSLVLPSLLLASGLASYTGVDLFPIASVDPALYARVRRDLATWGGVVRAGADARTRARLDEARAGLLERFDAVARVDGGKVVFDPARLELRCPVDAASLPFEAGRFDLCFSKSAFEHFKDVAAAARESVRVLAPGGTGLHEIDLRDHRDFSRPRAFLKFNTTEWNDLFDGKSTRLLAPELGPRREPFDFTNRLRASELAEAFRATGALVEVVPLETSPVSEAERAGFDARFRDRSREDLETLVALYVVKKPLG